MVISDRDISAIKKAIEIRNRGGYASGAEVTELYNRVLDKHLAPTNCGSCVRTRINELERALRKFETELQKAETQITEEKRVEKDGTNDRSGSKPKRKESSKKKSAN